MLEFECKTLTQKQHNLKIFEQTKPKKGRKEKMKKKKKSQGIRTKQNLFARSKYEARGITLIALVITIIVLLILVAVSIATLTGDNGILTKAQTAQKLTKQETAKEKIQVEVLGSLDNSGNIDLSVLNKNLENVEGITKGYPIEELPAELTVDGYKVKIDSNGKVTVDGEGGTDTTDPPEPPKEPTFEHIDTAETNPAGSMPQGATVVESDANNGIVIRDKNGNEWVWVEVPKSKMPSDLTFANETGYAEADQTKCDSITAALKTYAAQNRSWTDEWYDKYGITYDGKNEYSKAGYINYDDPFTEAKEYYGTIYKDSTGTEEATSFEEETTYYVKIAEKLNDSLGCGLTYDEYKETYQKMIKSVYKNGGFWIGRYEAGIKGTTGTEQENFDLARTAKENPIDTTQVIIQKDAIPYNWVTVSQAETLAKELSPDSSRTSSLLFGIQWDLVCKFLEVRGGVPQADINEDSKTWGNYSNVDLVITSDNAKGYSYKDETWNKISGKKLSYDNNNKDDTLLSTGASETTKKLNIYDFAGNEEEWTLEHATVSAYGPCSPRGGCFVNYSADDPVSYRENFTDSTDGDYHYSFRPALY